MELRFSVLGSGSKGNATLVEYGNTLLLVDCGFTLKETESRLAQLDVTASQITAILVTHEHGDHCSGVGALARRYKLPVFMTRGTAMRKSLEKLPNVHYLTQDQLITIGGFDVLPVTVPHDAREPCQFVFNTPVGKLGLLTDLGCITPHIIAHYKDCNALILECNHDINRLATGPYPASLKRRVGGSWGHLNNQQAADFLASFDVSAIQHLVLSHLSEQNNCPDLALAAISETFSAQEKIVLAKQDEIITWRTIETEYSVVQQCAIA